MLELVSCRLLLLSFMVMIADSVFVVFYLGEANQFHRESGGNRLIRAGAVYLDPLNVAESPVELDIQFSFVWSVYFYFDWYVVKLPYRMLGRFAPPPLPFTQDQLMKVILSTG